VQQFQTEPGSKQRRQGAIFRSLDAYRFDPVRLGVAPHLVKKDRLSDPTQPDQHHALGRSTLSEPLEPHFDVFAESATAS
jgi:hypothetical protein